MVAQSPTATTIVNEQRRAPAWTIDDIDGFARDALDKLMPPGYFHNKSIRTMLVNKQEADDGVQDLDLFS